MGDDGLRIHGYIDYMKNQLTTSLVFLLVLGGLSLQAQAATITLQSTVPLAPQLEAANTNFAPQGLGYDPTTNELLFIQQGTNTIYRTDLSGTIVGTRSIGPINISPFGVAPTAHHTTSVAADASNYYFTDYTCNSSCTDLYSIGKSSGSALAISAEIAAYGGYPIDVRNGFLYRTNVSTNYDYSNLNQLRVSAVGAPDAILTTIVLQGSPSIADFSVDHVGMSIWTLDYSPSASIRRFDLTTGAALDTFSVGVDGMTGGLTFANGSLYYYDWVNGSSTLSTFAITDDIATVPEPASLFLLGSGLVSVGAARRRMRVHGKQSSQ